MQSRIATIALSVLIPIAALATPNRKETIKLQVVSSKTKTHGETPGEVFKYTDLLFTIVDGKKALYACDQLGDVCPVMESGEAYSAEREGDAIYFSMLLPESKKALSVKYRYVGSW